MKAIDVIMFDLKESCDLKDFSEVVITEIAENDFKIEYHKNDPYHGFVYYEKITETEDAYECSIYESAYGDPCILIRDKNLRCLQILDIDTREVIRDFRESH